MKTFCTNVVFFRAAFFTPVVIFFFCSIKDLLLAPQCELSRNENRMLAEAGSCCQAMCPAKKQGQHLVLFDHCGEDEIHGVETVNTEIMYIKDFFFIRDGDYVGGRACDY